MQRAAEGDLLRLAVVSRLLEDESDDVHREPRRDRDHLVLSTPVVVVVVVVSRRTSNDDDAHVAARLWVVPYERTSGWS